MAKQILKVNDQNVAVVEDFQRRNVFKKEDLEKNRADFVKRIADIDELLAVFTP